VPADGWNKSSGPQSLLAERKLLTDRRNLNDVVKTQIRRGALRNGVDPISALCQETVTYKSEVSAEGFLPIVKSTTASGVQQSTSLNGGVLAGYRFFSRRIAE
jgi:hypothetical protein